MKKGHRSSTEEEKKEKAKARSRAWAKANPEKIRISRAKYRENNREKINADIRSRYRSDPGKSMARTMKWARNNPEKTYATSVRYIKSNREKVRAWDRKRYQANPEKFRIKSLDWAKNHRDRVNAWHRKWDKANRDKSSTHAAKRRAAVMNSIPPWISRDQLKQIEIFYTKSNRLTRETGIGYSVDHVWPLRGKTCCGLHVPWNLRVIPLIENIGKGNKILVSV